MRILLDGDACPVKAEAINLAAKWDLPVIIVASYNHVSKTDYPAHVQTVYVERGADQADYKIVALVQQGDIVVTQDYILLLLQRLPALLAAFPKNGQLLGLLLHAARQSQPVGQALLQHGQAGRIQIGAG